MSREDAPQTAAEFRSLADQAEAEATEAEALATAARARARAIRMRHRAATVVAETKAAEPVIHHPVTAEPKAYSESADADTIEPEVVNADASEMGDKDTEWPTAEPGGRAPGLLSRRGLGLVAAALAVIVILAALGAGVEMIVLHKNAVRERQRVAEYAAAARQGVVTLISLDYQHANEDVQQILEVSTGTFKDDFSKTAEDFTTTVRESKVVLQGTVQAAAVELDSVTDKSAVVLVASSSEVTNADGAKQDPRKYRLIVTVTREGGQFKMSKVEFIP
ncbi:hypothetical protein [Mycobacterium asiaticum]|uniref:hypothetical protein n=1 Tax=Mycobacterium asiaticum TaxID=1790 RepID=UPI0007EFC520|nr:hypothetical protein [Mycobacterium asiaticum]OBI97603.1 hypothetical protein A5661_17630 [Mycobacterium asiaticum]